MEVNNSSVFDKMAISGHQNLFFCQDKAVGLQAIVAIHDTTLGPAIGGVRMLPYESLSDAVDDALRLSEAITHKASLAGLNLGGGSRSEEHTSELQSRENLVCRLLLEK